MRALVITAALMVLAGASQAQTCEAGKITCHQWCKKYQDPTEQHACLFALETSCKVKFGGLDKCVPDTPPKQ
ncbi:MAG: hypothetical protein GEV13_00770 [Rhodospirillales bacterium]|nr:hypothetical protein [Rhodospirillales bacterium]